MAANKHPHPGPGRNPKRPEDRLNRRLAIAVTEETYRRFQEAAKRRNKSIGSYVRDAWLAADVIHDDPGGVIRSALRDPLTNDTFITPKARREPATPPLPGLELTPRKRAHSPAAAAIKR